MRKVVENIIAAKPKRVINIEPTTELLDLTHPRDLVSLVYIRSVDYQTQLFYDTRRAGTRGTDSHHRARTHAVCSDDQQ